MTAMLRMYMELSPPEIGGSMFALYSSVSNAGISVLASLTFYFVAPRLGNASGVLSAIPYVAVATLMISFMTLYKPAKKEPTQRQVIRNVLWNGHSPRIPRSFFTVLTSSSTCFFAVPR
jgi:hypothetical protein